MNKRDARLRTELIGVIIIKLCLLVGLWFIFVHGAHVPVDTNTMANHATFSYAISSQGEPNGH
jgi:hypothetical protein